MLSVLFLVSSGAYGFSFRFKLNSAAFYGKNLKLETSEVAVVTTYVQFLTFSTGVMSTGS
jgi:hypothetical protein